MAVPCSRSGRCLLLFVAVQGRNRGGWPRLLARRHGHGGAALRAGLALRRRSGDQGEIADALYDLAFVFGPIFKPPPEDVARSEQARRMLVEAEELYATSGNDAGVARSGWALGSLMLYRDMDRARTMLRASVGRYRGLDDKFGLGWALRVYGLALLGCDDSAGAAEAFREALGLFAAAEDSSAMGLLLDDVAEVARAEGDALRAARLKGAAASVRQVAESSLTHADGSPWIKPESRAGLVDPAALERAFAEGLAMTAAEAITFALYGDAVVELQSALRVTALGPFRVERSGQPVTHWGRTQSRVTALEWSCSPSCWIVGTEASPRTSSSMAMARRRLEPGRPELPPHPGRAPFHP